MGVGLQEEVGCGGRGASRSAVGLPALQGSLHEPPPPLPTAEVLSSRPCGSAVTVSTWYSSLLLLDSRIRQLPKARRAGTTGPAPGHVASAATVRRGHVAAAGVEGGTSYGAEGGRTRGWCGADRSAQDPDAMGAAREAVATTGSPRTTRQQQPQEHSRRHAKLVTTGPLRGEQMPTGRAAMGLAQLSRRERFSETRRHRNHGRRWNLPCRARTRGRAADPAWDVGTGRQQCLPPRPSPGSPPTPTPGLLSWAGEQETPTFELLPGAPEQLVEDVEAALIFGLADGT